MTTASAPMQAKSNIHVSNEKVVNKLLTEDNFRVLSVEPTQNKNGQQSPYNTVVTVECGPGVIPGDHLDHKDCAIEVRRIKVRRLSLIEYFQAYWEYKDKDWATDFQDGILVSSMSVDEIKTLLTDELKIDLTEVSIFEDTGFDGVNRIRVVAKPQSLGLIDAITIGVKLPELDQTSQSQSESTPSV